MTQTTTRWRAIEPRAIAWREWDDEFVVYHDYTGSTHHLSTLAGEVLLGLLNAHDSVDLAELARHVVSRVETPAQVALMSEVERTVAKLAELRLVEAESA